ncbi:MAG TPA: hypothetical protein VGJ86_14890 [Acidimicrobiales bacterium]
MTDTETAVTSTVEVVGVDTTAALPASRKRTRLLVPVVVAIAVSPIVIAVATTLGDPWYPVGDLAHTLFRVSQVGTDQTPLVGAESVKGWAHPGPILFWLTAPLYRLSANDPRALEWTAALINIACIAGVAAVAWRRGRWALLLGAMTMTAVLVHGFGPGLTISLWNPHAPLLPFLLVVFLIWDAGLGRRRALVEAVLPASIAMQVHVAFVSLVVVLLVWLVLWSRWGPGHRKLLQLWQTWRTWLGTGLLIALVLWIGPLLDEVFDLHNVTKVASGLATPPATVGPADAIGLVGRYVRPDGPWIGGPEPAAGYSIQGSGAAPLVLALLALGGCWWIARRRQLLDVAALSTLTLTLVIGAIPATSRIVLPVYLYLTQWLKIVGALTWFTVAWTGWRLAEPMIRATRTRQKAAGLVTAGALLASAAWTWGDAAAVESSTLKQEQAVQEIRGQLDEVLPHDQRIRVEYRGDSLNINGPGLIYWLIHDDFDVVTGDGAHGLKWGHAHRWSKDDPDDRYDTMLTIAVRYRHGVNDAYARCARDPSARLIAERDDLSSAQREWLDDVSWRQLSDPTSVSESEHEQVRDMLIGVLQIGVFEGSHNCADPRAK